MVARKSKKAIKKIKFQLTRSGVVGVGVVCFCIFLWMFLIGVWAGQSLLYPPVIKKNADTTIMASDKGRQVLDVIQLDAGKKKKIIKR